MFDNKLRRCPWSVISEDTWEYVNWWREWRTLKILPWRGELLDQPQFVLEVIEIGEQLLTEHECKQQKQVERENATTSQHRD